MEFCGGGSLQDIYHGKTKVIFYRDYIEFLNISNWAVLKQCFEQSMFCHYGIWIHKDTSDLDG